MPRPNSYEDSKRLVVHLQNLPLHIRIQITFLWKCLQYSILIHDKQEESVYLYICTKLLCYLNYLKQKKPPLIFSKQR
jgi:hypothetical protein